MRVNGCEFPAVCVPTGLSAETLKQIQIKIQFNPMPLRLAEQPIQLAVDYHQEVIKYLFSLFSI